MWFYRLPNGERRSIPDAVVNRYPDAAKYFQSIHAVRYWHEDDTGPTSQTEDRAEESQDDKPKG